MKRTSKRKEYKYYYEMWCDVFDTLDGLCQCRCGDIKELNQESYDKLMMLAKKTGWDYEKETEANTHLMLGKMGLL